ncbi:hypothetical protein Cgig2_007586 [Carnegiea gigantea]|uniref:Uncharacterized protein n=1 Tax=Carnegiea gigantea TaxID=171969 RepID=A0A9Q1QAA0_9CARY|nr:hypothetical protein Cgig2_007586 [Carnegiea gigantea]
MKDCSVDEVKVFTSLLPSYLKIYNFLHNFVVVGVHSHKEVNGDGQSEVHIRDNALDIPGEKGGVGELNLCRSSVDTLKEAEGAATERNVSDCLEVDNGHGDKVDSDTKVDGEVLEGRDRGDGERENDDKVEARELEKGDNCNLPVDDMATSALDGGDDDKVKALVGTDKGPDAESPDKDDVQNGASIVGLRL